MYINNFGEKELKFNLIFYEYLDETIIFYEVKLQIQNNKQQICIYACCTKKIKRGEMI